MTFLRLRIKKDLAAHEIQQRAIVEIYPLSGESGKTGRKKITIPVGGDTGYQPVSLEPGRYMVEAKVPWGEPLIDEVEILPNGPDIEVRFEERGAELSSWSPLRGNLRRRESEEETVSSTRSGGEKTTLHQSSLGRLASQMGMQSMPDGSIWELLSRSIKDPDFGAQLFAAPVYGIPNLRLQGMDRGDLKFLGDFSSDPPKQPLRETQDRHFVAVCGGSGIELVSVPYPWISLNTNDLCKIELLVRQYPQLDTAAFRSAVVVRDEYLGSALSFMTSGNLADAAVLFNEAKEALYYKDSSPLAAAAGADVLLSIQKEPSRELWHGWVKNLMNWFPWLPDGAIQYGRLKLRDQESETDVEEARGSLFEAYRRGLPFFSGGIRSLLAGLTVFAEDGDEEAEKMAKTVRAVSRRTDMSQPFTVIRLRGVR